MRRMKAGASLLHTRCAVPSQGTAAKKPADAAFVSPHSSASLRGGQTGECSGQRATGKKSVSGHKRTRTVEQISLACLLAALLSNVPTSTTLGRDGIKTGERHQWHQSQERSQPRCASSRTRDVPTAHSLQAFAQLLRTLCTDASASLTSGAARYSHRCEALQPARAAVISAAQANAAAPTEHTLPSALPWNSRDNPQPPVASARTVLASPQPSQLPSHRRSVISAAPIHTATHSPLHHIRWMSSAPASGSGQDGADGPSKESTDGKAPQGGIPSAPGPEQQQEGPGVQKLSLHEALSRLVRAPHTHIHPHTHMCARAHTHTHRCFSLHSRLFTALHRTPRYTPNRKPVHEATGTCVLMHARVCVCVCVYRWMQQ